MTFDGLFLHHMTAELSKSLTGGRIQKIAQPFDLELVLSVRANGKSKKLLLSVHPQFGRVQLTQTDFINPQQASTFVMILRKYLLSAIIEKIEQVENDRQLWFHISSKNEIGDDMKIALVVEIMGKHSNVTLLDKTSGKILEAIKHIGFSQNQFRTILPGSTYIAPPDTGLKDPFTATDTDLFEILQTNGRFQGFSKETCEALSKLDVETFRERIENCVPSLYPDDKFSSIKLFDNYQKFDNLSELLDNYYQTKAERDRVKQVASDVIHRVESELKKAKQKLKKQKNELAATENAEDFRQKGELLNTFLHQVPNNKTSVTLDNYYTNEPLVINLDSAYTPSQNAQRYFHRYQKLKQAVKFLTNEIEKTSQSISYLESVDAELANADIAEISDIKEELIETGFFKQKHRDKKHKQLPPEKYKGPDGSIILVGKNNLQNEQVSFKLSKKGDLWFHVKDFPSAHVLLTNNLRPSDEDITFAGELAAYFSKQRDSNLVQVDILEVKKLHKPTGTPPGFVTYNREKTIRVTPDPELIKIRKIKSKLP
ncbi:Rqc2 family fibronectin-binding protein [Lactovum miscens]|uniref:Rqc2 homolog RqcH n=1 Tax=Lactovum miscens TaxID=190387 RepID=A0A841CB87_9LACT|nr:NFACT RNA binding domain-containing protein [Lactovum miscens]MBB5888659.1 putative ribosome quality control (RQC) complex YloA/Tae2 family protein [Lactovum miscens]